MVALVVLAAVILGACIFALGYAFGPRLAPHATLGPQAELPELVVGALLLTYVLILIAMYVLVRSRTAIPVGEAIRWNWPHNWGAYILGGFALAVCLLPLDRLLPMPKNLPIEEFFKNTRDAYVLSFFGVFVAPLFEELSFRGFLYPVLARGLGMPMGILLTSVLFALLHGEQLRFSWGPLFVIFLVGVTLTTVRALKKSVAATVLMHMAYNGTIFIAEYIATDGFRHMEKFNQ